MLMLSSPELVRIDVVRLVELYGSSSLSQYPCRQTRSHCFLAQTVSDELSVQGDGSNPSVRSIQAY